MSENTNVATTYAERKASAKSEKIENTETVAPVEKRRGRPVGSTNSPKLSIPALRAYMLRTMAGLELLPAETLETLVAASVATIGKSAEFLASDERSNAAHLEMVETFRGCGASYRRAVFSAILAASSTDERAFYLAELS